MGFIGIAVVGWGSLELQLSDGVHWNCSCRMGFIGIAVVGWGSLELQLSDGVHWNCSCRMGFVVDSSNGQWTLFKFLDLLFENEVLGYNGGISKT